MTLASILKNVWFLLTKYGMLFVRGTGVTLLLSFITVLCGTVLGALLAMAKMSRIKPLSMLSTAYIEVVRGTPLLLQLYFFFFLLPMMFPSVRIFDSDFFCVTLALVFNSAAYVSEIIRSGIQAVDKGQTEAARSLGLSGRQTMTRVVLPQAVKNILPALGNEFVTVIKESSLAQIFFVGDLMTQYKILTGALALVIEPLLIVGVVYFVLTFSLSKLLAVFERRLKASD